MQFNDDLFNAVVIGENPESAFIVEGNHLHAVESPIAELKKDKSNLEIVLPLMRNAFEAILRYAQGKVPSRFTNMISLKENERDQLIEKIVNVYTHLHRDERNELSSMVHHKAK